jgi:hypothetical protein
VYKKLVDLTMNSPGSWSPNANNYFSMQELLNDPAIGQNLQLNWTRSEYFRVNMVVMKMIPVSNVQDATASDGQGSQFHPMRLLYNRSSTDMTNLVNDYQNFYNLPGTKMINPWRKPVVFKVIPRYRSSVYNKATGQPGNGPLIRARWLPCDLAYLQDLHHNFSFIVDSGPGNPLKCCYTLEVKYYISFKGFKPISNAFAQPNQEDVGSTKYAVRGHYYATGGNPGGGIP